MVARARMLGESFEAYRERLVAEDAALRQRLKGKMFHSSQQYVEVPDGKGGIEIEVQGVTYVKPKEKGSET